MRIIVNDIRERCERVQAEFAANFDRTEDKYVILADEFREYFRKKGFVPQSTQDAKESIDYMDSVMKKILMRSLQILMISALYVMPLRKKAFQWLRPR